MADSPVEESALQVAEVATEGTEQQTQLEPVKKTKKIIRKKKRPARVQVDRGSISTEPPAQTGDLFNIWYSKWSGGDRDDRHGLNTAAKTRCDPVKDSGFTKADNVTGSYFCLYFAKGTCWRGADCEYLHRIPTLHDLFPVNVDCFGRDKHSDYRDDMSGIGSFARQNRTIYVGRIHVDDSIEETVARHFCQWGVIARTRVLTGRGVAFVTYQNEANAQFAKEAMSNQALDHEEILNVRWATVDPNPLAQKREARQLEEQAAEAVRRALPAAFVAEIEGKDPEAKKRKKIEGSFGLDGYDVPDDVWHSRTRQLESAPQMQQLEAPEQSHMIEPVHAEPAPELEVQSGIFSSSTVAALRGLAGGNVITQSVAKPSGGPLVAYGSDDESD
ncbi:Pre-mRNA-splicing factor cwc2 [Penicillium malachiteum]|uniref:Pre-mRNA-splicing factor cwc2 n=1 Tax=Penicillium malachiteum TaxID=1324776 RepID=UPI002547E98A|nr:Pre-mRNA-splicing factor cwc2 [Penicillium malachiteum]KAJ5737482.1 Pre-mRNA-splicing factor cwc2 [Penicillium malachiteum]